MLSIEKKKKGLTFSTNMRRCNRTSKPFQNTKEKYGIEIKANYLK